MENVWSENLGWNWFPLVFAYFTIKLKIFLVWPNLPCQPNMLFSGKWFPNFVFSQNKWTLSVCLCHFFIINFYLLFFYVPFFFKFHFLEYKFILLKKKIIQKLNKLMTNAHLGCAWEKLKNAVFFFFFFFTIILFLLCFNLFLPLFTSFIILFSTIYKSYCTILSTF